MSTPPTNKYQDMGEVTGLRLELGRERDRADALAGALHKEVVAVIRRAVADVDTVGAQLVELDDVKAENARLKAEVEKWKSWAEAEHAEKKVVKAEVELTKCKSEADHQLKAELERIYRLDPLLREAIASAVLASKGGRP